MLNLALICAGLFSYTRLELNSMPEVKIPVVSITVMLPGASPSLVQSAITKPIEDVVAVISGVDTITSTSSTGMSQTTVKFSLSTTTNDAIQECRDKVDAISGQFPKGTEKATYGAFSSNEGAVAQITVSSDTLSLNEVTELAKKKIVDELQSVNGVGAVNLYGERERQIQIILDSNRLSEEKLSVTEVSNAVIQANNQIPGGLVTSPYQEYSLKIAGQLNSVPGFAEVVVKDENDTVKGQEGSYFYEAPLRVNQVAQVLDTEAELRSLSRLNSKPTLTLKVQKTSDGNLVEVVALLKKKIASLQSSLSDEIKIEMIENSAEPVQDSLDSLREHLVLGSFLACLVVLIFLRSIRLTIIAAAAIPVSLIASFAVMDFLGYTLNTLTLLALTLAVGLVIDDAIVVLENTSKVMEEKGLEPKEAARESLREIGSAVVATTISLAILFLPLSIMPGEVGLYFRSWGVVMAATVMISMLVSFSLTPVMCSMLLKKPEGTTELSWIDRTMQSAYGKVLEFALKFRFLVVIVAVVTLLSSLKFAQMVGKEFITPSDAGHYSVTLTFPQGWPPARIQDALKPVEEAVLGLPHIEDVLTTVDENDITKANLYVKMVPFDKRKPYTQSQSVDATRETLKAFPGLKPSVGSSQAKDFQYPIVGDDVETLTKLADELVKQLRDIDGFLAVDTDQGQPSPQIEVQLERTRLAQLNLKPNEVGDALNTLVGGSKITTYQEDSRSYDVYLRVMEEQRNNPEIIRFLPVGTTGQGDVVTLEEVASLSTDFGPSNIKRMSRKFQITVQANLKKSLPLQKANTIAAKKLAELSPPPGYAVASTGNTKLLKQTAVGALQALVLAIAFMFMVLASQYEDLLDPVIILSTIPLSVPFALISLVVCDMTLNLFSILGMFLLFGVVKKNAILQIEQTNFLMSEGKPVRQAILDANKERLRPILMTTLILVVAMLPVALAGATGATRAPMAVVVVGGQSLCLLLTLVVVPVATSFVEDGKAVLRRWRSQK